MYLWDVNPNVPLKLVKKPTDLCDFFAAEDRGGSVWQHPVSMVTAGIQAQPRVLHDSQEGRGTEETNYHPPRGPVPTGEIIDLKI